MSILGWLLVIYSVLLSVPVLLLFVEVIAAAVMRDRDQPGRKNNAARPSIAVLIPAHNESVNLLPTLLDVQSQLGPKDRLLVVADNCIDDTALVAKRAGSEVIERSDLDRIGKGFALDFGLRHLALEPPEVVIVIDADCRVDPGSIDQLAFECASTCRPAQSLDLMVQSENSLTDQRVAEFAWRLKNWVRPLGLSRLGLPCQLMGTGMAFPWAVIRSTDVASGEIVEDLRLGLELAAIGKSPLFCPAAKVTSVFPSSIEAARNQRARWEGGQLKLIQNAAPQLLRIAFSRRDFELLVLTLDMLIPPLTILAALLIVELFFTIAAFVLISSALPLLIAIASFLTFLTVLLIAWLKFGQDILTGDLSLLCQFIFEKVRLYARMYLREGPSKWVRTERNSSTKQQ